MENIKYLNSILINMVLQAIRMAEKKEKVIELFLQEKIIIEKY